MADYRLIYWPIPFRGQFIRAVLAWSGRTWDETPPDDIVREKDAAVGDQPLPYMAPPALVETATGAAMAEMPAILHWLGRREGLLPDDPLAEALTVKIVADTNDVLDEVTLYGGREMWTPGDWADYEPRLVRWMEIFGETLRPNVAVGTAIIVAAGLFTLWRERAKRRAG